jgi:hypothetical protein
MVKVGKTLKNILYGIPFVLAGLLNSNDVQAQKYTVNPFVSTNENGLEYDGLKTREQRDSLVQAKLNEDWVSGFEGSNNPLWDCTEYASQLAINFHGFPGLEGYSGENRDSILLYHKTLKDNGKYGLPIYFVTIPNGEGHNMNAILTGDDVTKFENWNFVEPQFDQMNVKPGEAYMPMDCEIEISYFYVNKTDHILDIFPILKYKITNETPNLIWINEDPNLKIIKEREKPNGLEKEVLDLNLKVYPNPSNDYINFEYYKNGNAELKIYSIDGKEIENIKDDEGNISLDLRDYSQGIYLYKYENEDGIKTGKIVKE